MNTFLRVTKSVKETEPNPQLEQRILPEENNQPKEYKTRSGRTVKTPNRFK